MRVKLEGQNPLEWIIPWKFIYGTDDEAFSTRGVGICWLWWTFYFSERIVKNDR